jgi:hypothetical protein
MSEFRSLRAYAREMLRADCLRLPRATQAMRCAAGWVEIVLHRSGPWQTELAIILAGVQVPQHRHPRCESFDLALAGSGCISVPPRVIDLCPRLDDAAPLMAQLLHVPRGAWHGGQAGPAGGAFLTFQRWDGGPDFVGLDVETR